MAGRLLWLAAPAALACRPALADGGKTVVGRCLAVIDGKTEQNGPCSIDPAVGGGFSFEASIGERIVHLVPDGVTHTGAASATILYPEANKDVLTDLGTLQQHGACWVGARAKLCAWDGEAEMRRNRAAPYTAFHTLLGRSVQARCHMGACEWLRYDRAAVVVHNDREVVLKIDGKLWSTYHPGDLYDRPGRLQDVTTGPFYLRCSHTRPASLPSGPVQGWVRVAYAPESDHGNSGAEEYAYTQYEAACDGLDHAVAKEEGLLLGYDTSQDRSDGDTRIDRPADALR